MSIQSEEKHLDGLVVEGATRSNESTRPRGTADSCFRRSPRPDFQYSQPAHHSDYSTFMPTLLTAFASTTVWISLPCLTSTKCRLRGERGFPGMLI